MERLALDLMIVTEKRTIVRGWAIGQMVRDVCDFEAEAIAIDNKTHPYLEGVKHFAGNDMLVVWQPGPGFERLEPIGNEEI